MELLALLESALHADFIAPFITNGGLLPALPELRRQQGMADRHPLHEENGMAVDIDFHGAETSTMRFSVSGRIS